MTEVSMEIINAGIQDPHQNSPARKPLRPLLHQSKTRGCLCLVYGKEQPLWFFCIFNFFKPKDPRNFFLRYRKNSKAAGQLLKLRFWKLLPDNSRQVSAVLYDQLPGPGLPVIAHIQLPSLFPFLLGH